MKQIYGNNPKNGTVLTDPGPVRSVFFCWAVLIRYKLEIWFFMPGQPEPLGSVLCRTEP